MTARFIVIAFACVWLAGCHHEGTGGHRSDVPEPQAQFRGFIRLGPEQMSFQPCGSTRDDRWWWAARDDVPGWKGVDAILDAQPRCDLDTMPCKLQEAYVELDGRLTEPGEFGHMGG